MVTRTKKGRVKSKYKRGVREAGGERQSIRRIWDGERGQRRRDTVERQDTDRSSPPRCDPEPTSGPSCCVKTCALRGQRHIQSSRLKGSNFTDTVRCCKNFHLANLALRDHKKLKAIYYLPGLCLSFHFDPCSSPRPGPVMIGQFFFSLSLSLSRLYQVLWLWILWHLPPLALPFLRARQLYHCQVFVCMAVSVGLSSPSVFPIGTTLGGTIC